MNSETVFLPSRLRGLLFQAGVLFLLLGASTLFLLAALDQPISTPTVLMLLGCALCFAPAPLFAYRAYALLRASYTLERDGLHLIWGLRAEDIPLTDVQWVRPAENLPVRLPLPTPSWPGALLGRIKTDELGTVEFLASGRPGLLLVATSDRVFAISPANPEKFLEAFQAAFEMGSLSPIPASSVLPAAYLSSVWSNGFARIVIIAGLVLSLLMLVMTGLVIPTRPTVSLGFNRQGSPLPPVPSVQLILLPILGLLFYLVDLGAGLYFYRFEERRPLAFLLWSSSILASLLLYSASVFILK